MAQEEKDLLLRDLAARVPYGVMVEQTLFSPPLADKEQRLKSVQANDVVQLYWYKYINEFVPIHCIKPYLRPMSSMTEEEREELAVVCVDYIDDKIVDFGEFLCEGSPININNIYGLIDWLNAHHFDYRGLIERGLALEAPEGMYNIK